MTVKGFTFDIRLTSAVWLSMWHVPTYRAGDVLPSGFREGKTSRGNVWEGICPEDYIQGNVLFPFSRTLIPLTNSDRIRHGNPRGNGECQGSATPHPKGRGPSAVKFWTHTCAHTVWSRTKFGVLTHRKNARFYGRISSCNLRGRH